MSTWTQRCFTALAFLGLVATSLAGERYRFQVHQGIDTNGTGHAASVYLLPEGWNTKDLIRWNLAQTDAPITESFVASSPDGKFAISYVNAVAQWYTRLPASSAAKSQGVPPPAQPTDVILQLFKNNHPGVDFQILERKETPIPTIFLPSPTQKTTAAKCLVRLKANVNGTPTIFEYAWSYQAYDSGTAWGLKNGFSNGHWYMLGVMSFQGPETEFDKAQKLAVMTLSSLHEDPAFYEFKVSVFNQIAKEQIQITNQILKDRFEAMNQYFKGLSDRSQSQFDQQQKQKADITRDMCDVVMDRERYRDGNTEIVVPNTIDHAYTNGSEYLFQTGPQYNDIPGNWKPLDKVD